MSSWAEQEREHASWLGSLAVGDEVAVISSGWVTRARFSSVERLTKTLIITATGGRFRRGDGQEPGSGRDKLERASQKWRDHEEKLGLLAQVKRRRDWSALDLPTLRAVAKALDASAPPKGGE